MRNETIEEQLPPLSRYIEKVCLYTGEVVDGAIAPEELLVESHRKNHLLDVYTRYLMGWLVAATGDEALARNTLQELHELEHKTADKLTQVLGWKDPKQVAEALFGLKHSEYYFRFKRNGWTPEELETKSRALKQFAQEHFDATRQEDQPQLCVLLTGGTGFVGKDILWRAVRIDAIKKIIVLIRPKRKRDPKTRQWTEVLSPQQRGEKLLEQLWLEKPEYREKVEFIQGDIEQPCMGVSQEDFERLCQRVTHVIHCAASVAFDASYEDSYQANVNGTLQALQFSKQLQDTTGSPFVSHISVETSYIHGRQSLQPAREDELVFPRNYYNNYYELTKAMASIETERFMFEHKLRVVQLCPSIVIGESRTGNNRGDVKVVNAPINAFGRVEEHFQAHKDKGFFERSRAWLLWQLVRSFPGNPTAELNLVPVDRVSEGIIAALMHPQAVTERIHLATDNRMTAETMQEILVEEVGIKVAFAEPAVHRKLWLPVMTGVLKRFGQGKLAHALEKMGHIFGGYSEWGQPIHEVGNDVKILGMSPQRPCTEDIFRMLCRHNKYVQQFGQIQSPDELSRRERVWWGFINDLETLTGQLAGSLSPEQFEQAVSMALDVETFTRKSSTHPKAAPTIEPSRLGPPSQANTLATSTSFKEESVAAEETITTEAENSLEKPPTSFNLSSQQEPMSSVDAAWLHMEEPTNLMVVSTILHFRGHLSRSQLLKSLQGSFLTIPRFRQCAVEPPSTLGIPYWEEVDTLELDYHIKELEMPIPGNQEHLQHLASELVSTPLDFSKPLWQMHLIHQGSEATSLFVRIHHCIGDGIALVSVLLSMTADSAEASLAPPTSETTKSKKNSGLLHQATSAIQAASKAAERLVHDSVLFFKSPRKWFDIFQMGAKVLPTAGHIVTQSADPQTPLKGPLGTAKIVAWSKPISLDEVKHIRKMTKTTVNDVLVAVMAGALGQYLKDHDQETKDLVLRALVPVNLRPISEMKKLGNKFGLVFLNLPVGTDLPKKRLQEVKAHMDTIKRSPEAFVALGLLKALGMTPSELQRFILDKLSAKATVVMTNVPGPKQEIYFAGQAIDSTMFWVPMSARMGLGISILSYAQKVYLGINADARLIPEPQRIIDAFHQEFERLKSTVGMDES